MPPPVWNLANAITLLRLLISIAFFVLFYKGTTPAAHWTAVGLFLTASLTDFLDGWVARKRGEVTPFGRMADPLVDKILVCGAMILLCFKPEAEHLGMTAGVAATVVVRELLVTWLRGYMESKGIPFGASWMGKLKLLLQTVAVGIVLVAMLKPFDGALYWPSRVTIWLMMGITIGSGLEYVWRAGKHLRGEFRS